MNPRIRQYTNDRWMALVDYVTINSDGTTAWDPKLVYLFSTKEEAEEALMLYLLKRSAR